jgi:hypothetical protein
MATPARNNNTQNVHYARKAFTYLDDGSSLEIVTVPAGSLILKPSSGVQVNVVFNAGTTNVADIGITGDLDLYATDLALGTIAFVPCDEAVTFKVTTDTTIYGSVDLTGTAATTGEGEFVVAYLPNN